MKKKFNLTILAEIAIFAALGFALDALQGGYSRGLFPSGGSIGIAMLPILVISYRRGLIPGLLCGLLLSIVQMLSSLYVINATSYENGFLRVMGPFIQIMLDYVLSYTLVGCAGVFAKKYKKADTFGQKVLLIVLGCILGGMLKYLVQTISGGVFWVDPSTSFMGIEGGSWLFSFIYNGAYNIPNIILCIIVMLILLKFYPQFIDINKKEELNNEINDENNLDNKEIEEGDNNNEE